MGLLEDAIREHLDLKRQHGADPGRVAAEEHEALGPIQRAAEPVVSSDEEAPEEAPAAVDEPVQAPADELDEDDFEEPPPSPRTTSASAPFDFEDEPFAPEPPPAPPEEKAAADEDVLEETPEFLQETPEHDRLWFEQKPPRDFDFDR
ncbi:MAG TPA: hypothetical protein VHR88_11120 [Solirubrobacteraceae bacterium]|jgi:hypothetical protein|nr:hypothetical protein [Solirubrobacteraceae bacterium]